MAIQPYTSLEQFISNNPYLEPSSRVIGGQPALTPILPASGVAISNNSGEAIFAVFKEGAVTSVTINGVLVGSPTIGQLTVWALNPGDVLLLVYSTAPTMFWYPQYAM